MYDLQKIILDNYVKKNKISVLRTERRNSDKTLFYYIEPKKGLEDSNPYITAYWIAPERFGMDSDNEQSWSCTDAIQNY